MDNDYIDIVEMKKLGSKLNGDSEILSAQVLELHDSKNRIVYVYLRPCFQIGTKSQPTYFKNRLIPSLKPF